MGACTEWFILIRAARYLGVAPWELATQSQAWLEWALASMRAEAKRRG